MRAYGHGCLYISPGQLDPKSYRRKAVFLYPNLERAGKGIRQRWIDLKSASNTQGSPKALHGKGWTVMITVLENKQNQDMNKTIFTLVNKTWRCFTEQFCSSAFV